MFSMSTSRRATWRRRKSSVRVTFGAPLANPTALQANYQPARNFTPTPPAGFGTAASVATPTADIAAKCPTCPIL
jgi:hypothetical protein